MAEPLGYPGTPPAEAEPSSYRWVMAPLMHSVFWIVPFFVLSLGVVLPLMREDLGFGPIGAGLLGTAGSLAPALFSVPAALAVVRFSPKLVMTAIMGFGVVLGTAQALAPTFFFLFVSRLLFAVVQPMSRPALDLLILQWFPKDEMGRIASLGQATGNLAMSVAIGATPFVIALLGGWRQAYLSYSLLALAFLVLWVSFGRERRTPQYVTNLSKGSERAPIKAVLRYPYFFIGGFAFVGNAAPWLAMVLFWPTFLLESRGLSLETAGVLTAFITIGGMSCSLFIGYISDKVGLRKPFMWPCWLVVPLIYFAMLMPLPVPVLGMLAFAMGVAVLAPVMGLITIPFELPGITPREVAVGRSITTTILTSGLAITPISVGFLWAALGDLSWALRISSMLPWLGLLMAPFIPETGPRTRAREKSSLSP